MLLDELLRAIGGLEGDGGEDFPLEVNVALQTVFLVVVVIILDTERVVALHFGNVVIETAVRVVHLVPGQRVPHGELRVDVV